MSVLEKPEVFAKRIGVSRTKVYGLIRLGLPVVQVIASKRIDPEDAIRWLKSRSTGGADE